MNENIGRIAGEIWEYLHNNGEATVTRISKAIQQDAASTHQAIGWLAREGKINIDRSKRVAKYSLWS